jgi:hypothetical protein
MEQMMARLLAEIRTNRCMTEETRAWRKEMKAHPEAMMDACLGKTEATNM